MLGSGEGGEAWVKIGLAGGGLCVWAVCEGVDEGMVILDDRRGDDVGEFVVNSLFKLV